MSKILLCLGKKCSEYDLSSASTGFGFVPVSFGRISTSTDMTPKILAHALPSPVSTDGRFKEKLVHSWIIALYFKAFSLLAQYSLFFYNTSALLQC